MSEKVIYRPTSIESMAMFSRPLPNLAVGLPRIVWEPLRTHWTVAGLPKLDEAAVQWFLHTPSGGGK